VRVTLLFLFRPVPDFEWTTNHDLWNNTADADAMWAEVVANISRVYPRVKAAGYKGLVYDNEGLVKFISVWLPRTLSYRRLLSFPVSSAHGDALHERSDEWVNTMAREGGAGGDWEPPLRW
jgi:hypothetical protein